MSKLGKKVLVDLFYDVTSPYSYISFVNFTRYTKKWENMELNLRPVYLAGIFSATNNTANVMVPAKGKYMMKDLPEISKFFNIDFKFPKDPEDLWFVKSSIKPQRLLTAIKSDYPNDLEKVSTELFQRVWVKDLDVSSIESLKVAMGDCSVSEDKITKLIESISGPEIKVSLKVATQDSLDHGAFGLPTFVAYLDDGPKMFFGNERLFLLADYLNQPTFSKPVIAKS